MRTSIHQQRNKLWTFVSSCSLWFWLWKNKKSKELAAALNESSEPWLINYISKSHDGPENIIFILLVVGSWSAKACLYQTFLKHFDKFIIQYRGKKLYTTDFFFIYLLASRVYVDNGISCSLYQKIVEDLRRPVSRCLFLEKGKKKEKRKKRVFLLLRRNQKKCFKQVNLWEQFNIFRKAALVLKQEVYCCDIKFSHFVVMKLLNEEDRYIHI